MALGYMRRHRRWLYAFLWVVILGFIVFYIPAFRSADAGSPGETIGSVAGEKISVGEFQRAYQQRRRVYEQLYEGRLDAAALKGLGLEDQVFEGLVAERLLRIEARRQGLSVSDDELAKNLANAPDLQENGRFIGVAELKRRLALSGSSVAEFEEGRRERLLAEKLQTLVTAGVSVTPTEVEREFRRRSEQIRAEYALVDASRFRTEASASDDEIKARFESRKEAYRLPEKRAVSYAYLDAEALRARVTVTDRDVEAYYQEHKEEFREPEQVCASHVLFKVKGQSAEGHADAEAKQLGQAALARLKAGADFATVAKKDSEDKGSAPGGGDLGCFPRGRMVKEFESAVWALEPGQLSDLVKTGFGYHVIRLNSRREESYQSLADVKGRVRETLLGQRVRELSDQKAQNIAATLQRGRGLEEAAKAEGLTLQKSAAFARGEAVPPIVSPQLVARAFELKAGEIEKDPFQLPRGVAFIQLAEVQPSRAAELKDVRDKVKADLLEEKALERARLLAVELRARAEKTGLDKAASALGLVRKETPSLVGRGQAVGDLGSGAALEEAAFGLAEKTLSEPVRTVGGYAILRVIEKKSFDPLAFEKQRPALEAALREAKRGQLFQAYLGRSRERVTVERHPEVYRRVAG